MSDLLKRLRNRKGILLDPINGDGSADEQIWVRWPDECPPNTTAVWSTTEGAYLCEPIPPIPTSPISESLGHINIQNILRTKIQMGNEHGVTKGWGRVIFPEEMLSAHVIAVSGPRSAKAPRADIAADRRTKFITRSADAAKLAVRSVLEDANMAWVMDTFDSLLNLLDPAWWIELIHFGQFEMPETPSALEFFIALFSRVSSAYAEVYWDYIIKPMWQEFDNVTLENVSLWGLADSWGIERGRSVHNVNIQNITGTGFEWYSYGDMYINWIAIGVLPEGQAPIPPELQGPVDEINAKIDELKLQFDEELQKIHDYFARFDITPPVEPTTTKKGIFPIFDRE